MQEAEEVQEQMQEIPQVGRTEQKYEYSPTQERENTQGRTAADGMGLEELFDLLADGRPQEYEEPIPHERRRRKKRRTKR